MAYAEKTEVSVEKTLAELLTMVRNAGGRQIAQGEDDDRFILAFTLDARQVRFTVRFPTPDDAAFARTRTNATATREATDKERMARWDQRRRQRMRALLLVIKAKLESVESQVETFEQAFLANVVMHDGRTVHEHIAEPIALQYETGRVQPLMLTGPQS